MTTTVAIWQNRWKIVYIRKRVGFVWPISFVGLVGAFLILVTPYASKWLEDLIVLIIGG